MPYKKLSRIQSPWRRFMVTLVVSILSWIGGFTSRRAYAHWVGHQPRRRRPERAIFLLLLLGSLSLFRFHPFIFWCVMWGGTLSIFVNLHTLYRYVFRRRYHWVTG